MEKYTVYATLEIKAEGKGTSPQEVLDKAVSSKKYEVINATMNSQPVDNYIVLSEYARRHHIADGGIYLRKQCREGKIPTAKKVGRDWCIPADTPHVDRRLTAGGKYAGLHEKNTQRRKEKLLAATEAEKGV
ncbi:MAG: hypothetical protein J6W84_03510 [Bacteroidales bacterium]|nr:hypothetical protein [Bacteroidales bacterium]